MAHGQRLQHAVCLADSGIGLQEDEEASVNSLINQLEHVGRQQVRGFLFANILMSCLHVIPGVTCCAGTTSS